MVLFKLLGIVYALAQVLLPCLPPVPLSSEVLTTDQYLGKWYFVGVASWDDEDIESFKPLDNSVTELKKGENNTLVMVGALQNKDQCLNQAWTYHINPDLDPLMTEGPAENLGVFLDGKWIKCSSCLLIAKLHPNNGFLRIMLFARTEKTPDDLVQNFMSKMECFSVIDKFVITPRTKAFCKLEETN
ncbi:apolipoprotein M [Tachysurus vachellii]|uniref:apolipoprotein M n=1 Tax=Tachysurus vachellii TaxID=175792 RepID=UPI00296AC5FB|nr:apolipoprotein M [Tachysurus vachellii]